MDGGPALTAAFLCGVFAFLDLYCTQPLLPLLARVFHASRSAVGTTVSASTFGVAIAAALLAMFGQRLPRKRTLVIGLAARSAVTALCALATSIPTLAAARFAQGLLVPTVSVMTVAYVTEEWPSERVPRAMSVYVSGTVLGGFLGRFLAGLIAEETSWQLVFVVLSLLGALGVVAIARLLPRSRNVSAPAPRLDAMKRALRDPRLLATFGVGICMLFTLVGAFSYVTFYLSAPPFSLGTSQLSWLFVVYLFGLGATLVAGRRLSPERLRHALYASAATVIVGLLLTLWQRTAAVAAGLALIGTGVFIAQTCTNAFLRDASPPEARVTATGAYVCAYYVGGTLGGVVPAAAFAHGGWPSCIALFSTVMALASLLSRLITSPALEHASQARGAGDRACLVRARATRDRRCS